MGDGLQQISESATDGPPSQSSRGTKGGLTIAPSIVRPDHLKCHKWSGGPPGGAVVGPGGPFLGRGGGSRRMTGPPNREMLATPMLFTEQPRSALPVCLGKNIIH